MSETTPDHQPHLRERHHRWQTAGLGGGQPGNSARSMSPQKFNVDTVMIQPSCQGHEFRSLFVVSLLVFRCASDVAKRGGQGQTPSGSDPSVLRHMG